MQYADDAVCRVCCTIIMKYTEHRVCRAFSMQNIQYEEQTIYRSICRSGRMHIMEYENHAVCRLCITQFTELCMLKNRGWLAWPIKRFIQRHHMYKVFHPWNIYYNKKALFNLRHWPKLLTPLRIFRRLNLILHIVLTSNGPKLGGGGLIKIRIWDGHVTR